MAGYSWFDRLTTNGLDYSRFYQEMDLLCYGLLALAGEQNQSLLPSLSRKLPT